MVYQQRRDIAVVDVLGHVNLHTIHHPVGAPVQDDTLDIGQGSQLGQRDVVGVYLTVHAKGTDFTGQSRIFLTAQIQNDDHILFHWQMPPYFSLSNILSCRVPSRKSKS